MRQSSHANLFCRALSLTLLLAAALVARAAQADPCRPAGQPCLSNKSCCSRTCVGAGPPGSQSFGTCCTPTTCAAQGKNCGSIPNGTCPDTLDCGTCTFPETCGAETPNVCGCTPTTCAAQGKTCGTISNGCGGRLSCGSCAVPDTCGGGGTPNVCGCTPLTCDDVGATCGTIANGCGGTVDCTTQCSDDSDCSATQRCITPRSKCEDRLSLSRGCRADDDCLSGCCCVLNDAENCVTGVGLGFCDTLSDCTTASRAGAAVFSLAQCPGTACQSDDDCNTATESDKCGAVESQFCSGGVCRMKQELDSPCSSTSACGGGDEFVDGDWPPECCCSTATSTGVCSTQDKCIRISGGTCECGDPDQFGGVCLGSPCDEDSDCNLDEQFCTSGACRPKQVADSACSFSSQCLGPAGLPRGGCCCDTGGAVAQCKDFELHCEGTCLP